MWYLNATLAGGFGPPTALVGRRRAFLLIAPAHSASAPPATSPPPATASPTFTPPGGIAPATFRCPPLVVDGMQALLLLSLVDGAVGRKGSQSRIGPHKRQGAAQVWLHLLEVSAISHLGQGEHRWSSFILLIFLLPLIKASTIRSCRPHFRIKPLALEPSTFTYGGVVDCVG